MKHKTYTPDQMACAERLAELLSSIPEEKRNILIIAAEAFIAGIKSASAPKPNG